MTLVLVFFCISNRDGRAVSYKPDVNTGEEIEIDEEKELSIVVDGQRSETDL
jgi:hypothetical protein